MTFYIVYMLFRFYTKKEKTEDQVLAHGGESADLMHLRVYFYRKYDETYSQHHG